MTNSRRWPRFVSSVGSRDPFPALIAESVGNVDCGAPPALVSCPWSGGRSQQPTTVFKLFPELVAKISATFFFLEYSVFSCSMRPRAPCQTSLSWWQHSCWFLKSPDNCGRVRHDRLCCRGDIDRFCLFWSMCC